MERRGAPSFVAAVAVSLGLGACSQPAAEDTSPREETTVAVDDLASTPSWSFPPIDPAVAAAASEAIDSAGLAQWLSDIEAGVPSVDGVAQACSAEATIPEGLTDEQFEAALPVADEVLAELVLNADAALRTYRHWCQEGENDLAAAELADLRRTLDLAVVRQEMLRP